MSDEPNSIWKKPLRPSQLFWVWLILASVITLIDAVVVLGQPRNVQSFADWLWFILLVPLFGGLVSAGILLVYAFIRWLCCWRNLRRALFGLACFATLMALFYAEEDWRGWHAWSQFKQKWEAKGEHFDFASVVPAPVPDDQNFALTPIAFTSYGYILTREGKKIPSEQRDPKFVQRIKMEATFEGQETTNRLGDRAKGTFASLADWQGYYRTLAARTNVYPIPAQPQSPAADVLLALSPYAAAIEELRAASQLPYSRFPLDYDNENPAEILLPHLAALKHCSSVLRLRSLAELQNGQTDQALADVTLTLRLTDKIRTEPCLISQLVRIAMLQIILQPVWEGLAERKWSDAQLGVLDAELTRLDFLPDYQLGMRSELGFQSGITTYLRHHPEQIFSINGNGDAGNPQNGSWLSGLVVHLVPGGWYYQNQLRAAQLMVKYYLPVADTNQGTFVPKTVREGEATLFAETKTATPYNTLERMMVPALGNCASKFAYAQASVDLARTAVALERYRLAQGEFPAALEGLAPQFIARVPHDVIGGGPLKYRREANGLFTLYSIGWNEKDDGGVVVFTSGNSPKVDNKEGDWVWRYPAK